MQINSIKNASIINSFQGRKINKSSKNKQRNMLKKIGTLARKDMEKNFGTRINLKTWVKVKKDWQNDEKFFK